MRFVHKVQGETRKHFRKFTLECIVNLDETYPHAGDKGVKQRKPRKKHLRKRGHGTWKSDKPPCGYNGKKGKKNKVRLKVMRDLRSRKVKLSKLISGKVILNTDEYTIYESIADNVPEIVEHRVVNHSKGEWVRGGVHVNTCENRNQFLKAYLRRYRGVAKRYPQGYLDLLALLLNEKNKMV